MPRLLNLVKTLTAWGLEVEYVPGWSKRGSATFNPVGVMDHWTAGPKGSKTRPSLNVVTHGHSTLPGPLCNVYLARDGVCVVVASGRANHAGHGRWKGYTGNSRFVGIEAEAAGPDDWTDAQRAAYPRLNAALLDAIKQTDVAMVCGHSEYALPKGRKIDINGYTMSDMRAQTKAIMQGKKPDTSAPKPTGSAPTAPKPSTPKKSTGTGIVDWLNSKGRASSFAARAKLAAEYGISGYKGTAVQNNTLLALLKAGAAPKKQNPAPAKPKPKASSGYKGGSIVDYLASIGKSSSFTARKKLAAQYGIKGYTGTAAQNTALLNAMRGGKDPAKASKSISQMATEVIQGKHGSGHATRQKSLGISAAKYAQVRAEVNKRL